MNHLKMRIKIFFLLYHGQEIISTPKAIIVELTEEDKFNELEVEEQVLVKKNFSKKKYKVEELFIRGSIKAMTILKIFIR